MYTAVAVVGSVLPFLFLKDGFMSCSCLVQASCIIVLCCTLLCFVVVLC
jgi:hypothetical protein